MKTRHCPDCGSECVPLLTKIDEQYCWVWHCDNYNCMREDRETNEPVAPQPAGEGTGA